MDFRIEWSALVEFQFDQTCEYLNHFWGKIASKNFAKKVERKLASLRAFPFTCQAFEDSKGVRRCVINAHVSLYFEVHENAIILHCLFQNRMDRGRLDYLKN